MSDFCCGVSEMVLDLKSIFLNEDIVLRDTYVFDMTDTVIDGIKPFGSAVTVEIRAENRAGIVRLFLAAVFDLTKPCDRCGTEVTRKFQYHFEHYLVVSLSGDQNDDYIETPDYTLDIDELLRSDILLELPSKYLCREDCKGLCPICGADRNEGQCNCAVKPVDSRLEALRQLIN